MGRIFLSPPDMSEKERDALLAAFDSNWVAPAGPDLAAFESELCERLGLAHAVALSSGTAALHLALLGVGVERGDAVIVPSLTFAATANAVRHVGADPVFVDSETATWNLDPARLAPAVERAESDGRRVAAVVTVDLFGQCADHGAVRELCDPRGIPVVEDAAEAVGATWEGRSAGGFGDVGVLSFNGNKLLTTGGGGMLVSADPDVVARARHLATQARKPVRHFEHDEVGFNYRMSNLLAAVGRGQVARLDDLLARRRSIHDRYRDELGSIEGVAMAPIDPRGRPNHWLSVITLHPDRGTPDQLIDALEAVDAEARRTWKPMHRQPVWADAPMIGGEVADGVFATGVCLPSGSSLTDSEQSLVISTARAALGA